VRPKVSDLFFCVRLAFNFVVLYEWSIIGVNLTAFRPAGVSLGVSIESISMDKTNFDAAAAVQFNLNNGMISSSIKEKQLTLLPIEILTAFKPGAELEKVANQYGHLNGEQLLENLPQGSATMGMEALADHLGGTTAVLGMGRLSLEIQGDALLLRVRSETDPKIVSSQGYQVFVCEFWGGYLSALAKHRFDVLLLEETDGNQRYFAGNPEAVKKVRDWRAKGVEPSVAMEKLARGSM
jgi:hypothetical protein